MNIANSDCDATGPACGGGSDYRPSAQTVKWSLSVSPEVVRTGEEILLSESIIDRFVRQRNRIKDVNFTCHVEPFMADAHGVYLSPRENEVHLTQMLRFQEITGITVSPVFNNIYVPNTRANFDRFMPLVETLYDRGIRSLGVPHLLWMKYGKLNERFPGLRLKNTVLRRVRSAQDFWNHASAGYDYVNIDRLAVRDPHLLAEIKLAQTVFRATTGRHVDISLLDGEGCPGSCDIIGEHHQHTLTHPGTADANGNLEVFRFPQQFSCLARPHPEMNWLVSVGMPFWAEDFCNVCKYIDVIKLPGRRTIHSLEDGLGKLEMISKWDEGIAPDAPETLLRMVENPATAKDLENWRKVSRTCRFQCWSCQVCQKIIAECREQNGDGRAGQHPVIPDS